VIVSAVAELERNLIIERVRAGLRRARLEGRTLGRKPIEIDRVGLLRDRTRGLSLAQLAKAYKISRTSVARALKQSEGAVPSNPLPPAFIDTENTPQKREHPPILIDADVST
jgi:DNA invertase Pin-like site-specific DNA recombinase